jgi:hypothetical protein
VGRPPKTQSSKSQKLKQTSGEGSHANEGVDQEGEDEGDGRRYWLMKAEPESRIEKGVDVKFSIDDLRTATKPQPWDGELYIASPRSISAISIWALRMIFVLIRMDQGFVTLSV